MLGAGGAVVGASLALVGVAGGVVQAATTKEQLPWLLKEVDRLHDNDKMSEALELLQPLGEEGEGEEVEVLWRLARLCFKVHPSLTCAWSASAERLYVRVILCMLVYF